MKTLLVLIGCLAAEVRAQSVYYVPNDLTALSQSTGDGSVWNITVTGGGIAAGVYDAWCFSSDHPGYGGSDFGASFESSLVSLNDLSAHSASSGVNKTGAMVNYVFDRYYGFWNESGLSSAQVKDRYYGFHEILWEIQKDYDPSLGISSFNLSSGAYTSFSSYARNLISGDLSSAYSGLSSAYTSGKYELQVISGHNITKNGNLITWDVQPLIVVSQIPEPSQVTLCGLAGGLLMLRRRRKA